MAQKTFTAAMREFFGDRPGASGAGAFLAEMKALSYEDKCYFHAEMLKIGMDVSAPQKTA